MDRSRWIKTSISPPGFVFPSQTPTLAFEEEVKRPQIKLQTQTQSEAYRLSVPRRGLERIASSPPDSPTRMRAHTSPMSGEDFRMLHDSGAITPPPTPTRVSHSKNSSTSSAYSLSSLRRGDSVSSTTSRRRGPSLDESERPGSTDLRRFPYWVSDYDIADKKKPLGSGLWSDVYLAKPSLRRPSPSSEQPPILAGPEMTPPITPIKSRSGSLSSRVPITPKAYAIKVPASKSSKKVLDEEAKVLSYLSRFPESERYIVPFFGQDTRSSALVLKAMDTTLEDWIHNTLNTLPEPDRAKMLTDVFPSLASTLINGLQWMQAHTCVHADIKPSNILLSLFLTMPSAVYSDFSSATITTLPSNSDSDSRPEAPLGGGTWDFLDPTLVAKASDPKTPTPESDLWALAMTLLYLVIGASPYDCAGSNVFRRREFVKQGCPVGYVAYGDDGPRNLRRTKALSEALGFDVKEWFEKVLEKDPRKRVGVEEWRGELDAVVGVGSLRL
ncbi:kinase-like domain-containing protein [Lophiotrema nucula]|uniref:Autophagy-related protein 1 n=1 Tax=Lophiotrema nucula TaxID=690887 RepID=A0A6A5ZKH9_9PLEO|nr:kinase-like domain-containing protein [Lophiotrema nucula]